MTPRKRSLVVGSKVALGKQKALLSMFSVGVTARAAARAVGVNRNTAARFFRIFRRRIALHRAAIAPFVGGSDGACEIDECYVAGGPGGKKVSRRGRSLAGKFAIVGVAQRDKTTGTRRVRMECLPRVNAPALSDFALRNVAPGSLIHTDQFLAYKLAPLGFIHRRVNHSRMFKNFRTGACTNNIESAWSQLRRHFSRFCGGWRHSLDDWLKEMEMRIESGVKYFYRDLSALFAV